MRLRVEELSTRPADAERDRQREAMIDSLRANLDKLQERNDALNVQPLFSIFRTLFLCLLFYF